MKTPAETVMTWADAELTKAEEKYHNRSANLAATRAGERVWNRMHPEDGVGSFSVNPYNATLSEDRLKKAEDEVIHVREVRDFVRTKICNLV